MAGDWIKVEKDTPDKPEILAIAASLGISAAEAFGRCFLMWRWADSHTVNGDARVTLLSHSCDAKDALLASLDVQVGVTGFAKAMLSVGWLEILPDGIRFPNFGRHMSQSSKRRALAQKRMKKCRRRPRNAPVTPKSLPEKRREENIYNPPLPPLLDTPEFKKTWGEWVEYRKQKGQRLTKISVGRQIKTLSESPSVQAAIGSLEQSMTNGWTGLFEFVEKDNGSKRTVGQSSRVRAEPGKYNGIGTTVYSDIGGGNETNGDDHAGGQAIHRRNQPGAP